MTCIIEFRRRSCLQKAFFRKANDAIISAAFYYPNWCRGFMKLSTNGIIETAENFIIREAKRPLFEGEKKCMNFPDVSIIANYPVN